MLSKIVEACLRNRLWVLAGFAGLAVTGALELGHLPIDAVPDITNVQVMINTSTGALDPEKVEAQVTFPIETEMSGLPRIEEVRSLSKYGLSQVTAVFQEGTDIFWARPQVLERLQNVKENLPAGTNPELAPMTTGLGEVFMYALEAEPGSELARKSEFQRLLELRTIQDFTIRPQLRRVVGVADVDSNGGFKNKSTSTFFPTGSSGRA